jgi:hypothetical protein
MKLFKLIACIAILVTSVFVYSFADGIGLTINPYAAMQIGNVAAPHYVPVVTFECTGIYVGYDIGLGDAGKITPGLEDYARISFPASGETWQDWLEVSATYSIATFGIKASLPFTWGGPAAPKQMLYSFYLWPSYKLALDKQMSIVADMRSWFYVFGQYLQLSDTVQLEPRIRLCYADFYVMGRMDLRFASMNNLSFWAFAGYTVMGLTPELSVRISNINPAISGSAPGITPYFKLIYKVVL